jgi:hypothetical protein
MTSKPEWEFGVPPEQVDLERIRVELSGMPAIYAMSYMEQFEANAPKTHKLYMHRIVNSSINTGASKCDSESQQTV